MTAAAQIRALGQAVVRELGYYRRVAAHPDTPWLARLLLLGAVAYAVSPIDLIPDMIPILGQLDDMVIVPFLAWLALRCTPADVRRACRNPNLGQ